MTRVATALLAGVDVLWLGDARRRVEALDPQQRAVGVCGCLEEAHALAGARIADLLLGLSHDCSLIG